MSKAIEKGIEHFQKRFGNQVEGWITMREALQICKEHTLREVMMLVEICLLESDGKTLLKQKLEGLK